jgi:hypothetical protein
VQKRDRIGLVSRKGVEKTTLLSFYQKMRKQRRISTVDNTCFHSMDSLPQCKSYATAGDLYFVVENEAVGNYVKPGLKVGRDKIFQSVFL